MPLHLNQHPLNPTSQEEEEEHLPLLQPPYVLPLDLETSLYHHQTISNLLELDP